MSIVDIFRLDEKVALIPGGSGAIGSELARGLAQAGAKVTIDAGYSTYVAAKGAIDALTRQGATEWAKHGITVNVIAPTFIDTPQVAMLLDDPEFKAKLVSRIPLSRVGQPSDLIGAVLLLLRRLIVHHGPGSDHRRRAGLTATQ